MSKVTVITDARGDVVAIGHGHLSEATARKNGSKGARAGLRALPGQQLSELDLKDNVEQLTTFAELRDMVRPYVTARA